MPGSICLQQIMAGRTGPGFVLKSFQLLLFPASVWLVLFDGHDSIHTGVLQDKALHSPSSIPPASSKSPIPMRQLIYYCCRAGGKGNSGEQHDSPCESVAVSCPFSSLLLTTDQQYPWDWEHTEGILTPFLLQCNHGAHSMMLYRDQTGSLESCGMMQDPCSQMNPMKDENHPWFFPSLLPRTFPFPKLSCLTPVRSIP